MKWGYTIWMCGWLSLAVGIFLIIIGLVSDESYGIWRGIAAIVVSFAWLVSGSRIIRKHSIG